MRYVVPIMMMIAAAGLGCRSMQARRGTKQPAPQAAGAKPQARSLSALAPQPAAPTPAESPAGTPAPTPGATYTVVKGDSFWSIARRAYGDGKLWTKIQQANPGVDPNDLNVGRVITIPPK